MTTRKRHEDQRRATIFSGSTNPTVSGAIDVLGESSFGLGTTEAQT